MDAPTADPPVTQKREFWVLVVYALVLGVFGGVVGWVVLEAIKLGSGWIPRSGSGWFDGSWWWVGVTAGAGLVVGTLRQLMRLPADVPDMFATLRAQPT